MRYTRVSGRPSSMYISTTAVVMAEIFKLTVALAVQLQVSRCPDPVMFDVVVVVVVVVVLTLIHRYNAVRGHRTGSNSSGAEDYYYLRRKTNKNRR